MIVNLTQVLKIAEQRKCAIPSFNTPGLEYIMAVIQVAEKHNVPVIISHAQVHETIMPLSIIGPIMVDMAKKSTVPICVHLDHGGSLDYLQKALAIGFTSIMYDGSKLSYEENVQNTIKAREMARAAGASIEAEIGIMGGGEAGSEQGAQKHEDIYTDPNMAKRFVEETDIDALAASFGTAHGIYKTKPKLDFDRIAKIKELTNVPLVMHGGSGVSPEDYVIAIEKGIRKINYYSYMAIAGAIGVKDALKTGEIDFFNDLAQAAVDAMAIDIEKAVKVFYSI